MNKKETLFNLAIDILQPLLAKVDIWFLQDKGRTWSDFLRELNVKDSNFYDEFMESINFDSINRLCNKGEEALNEEDSIGLVLDLWAEDHLRQISEDELKHLSDENKATLNLLQLEKQKNEQNLMVCSDLKEQQQKLQAQSKISSDQLNLEKQLNEQQTIQLKELNVQIIQLNGEIQKQNKISVEMLNTEKERTKEQNNELNLLKDRIVILTEELRALKDKINERQQCSSYQSASTTPSITSSFSPNKRKADTTTKIDYRYSLFQHYYFPSSMYFTAQLHYQNLLFVTEELNFDDTVDSLFKCLSIKLLSNAQNSDVIKAAYFEYLSIDVIEENYQITRKDIDTIVKNFNTIFKSFRSYSEQIYSIQVWEYGGELTFQCLRSVDGSSSNDTNNIYLLYYIDVNNNDLKFRIVNPLHIFYEK